MVGNRGSAVLDLLGFALITIAAYDAFGRSAALLAAGIGFLLVSAVYTQDDTESDE